MNDPTFRIPEPSLPEHHLLREAGSMPQLSSGLRDRVLLNCHQQVRSGRRADRLRIVAAVAAACLLVSVVWNFRGTAPAESTAQHDATPIQKTAQHDPPTNTYPYQSPGTPPNESDSKAQAIPQGGPSMRREVIPEMRELNQMIEKLQSRQNVLCGFLPFL